MQFKEINTNYGCCRAEKMTQAAPLLCRLVALNAIRSSEVLDMNPSNSLDVMDSKKIVDGRWFFSVPLHTVDRLQCFQKFQLFPTFNEKICIHMWESSSIYRWQGLPGSITGGYAWQQLWTPPVGRWGPPVTSWAYLPQQPGPSVQPKCFHVPSFHAVLPWTPQVGR